MDYLQALPQSILTNPQVLKPFILTGVGTLLIWLILSVRNSGAWKLRQFPTVGSSLPILSLIDAIKYIKDSNNIVETGKRKWPGRIFKVSIPSGWQVVITDPKHIDDIRRAPGHILSARRVNEEAQQAQYTIDRHVRENKMHHSIIKIRLKKELESEGLVRNVHEELVESCDQYIPVKDEWTSVVLLDNMRTIVARAANRVFVGPILCKNPDWVKVCVEFTTDLFETAFVLALFPEFLRPLVNYFVGGKIAQDNRLGLELLKPLIAARRDEKGDETFNDFLMWLVEESEGEDSKDWPITARIFALNVGAIHTSSMALTHVLLDLAANPEYMKPLREEVDEVTRREGWSKSALDQMHKLDSFVKESQRLRPIGLVMMGRYAVVDFTFSDGTFIPAGTVVGVSSNSVHRDPRVYEDPDTFDGFRFVKMKERAALEGHPDKNFDMVTTNADFVAFSQGRHACPGRYFAAAEIKLIFAHIVATYDMKLEEGARPQDLVMINAIMPNPDSKVYFRKRQY